MPIDLAIAAALERAVSPPPPPVFAIEQPWRSEAASHAQREADRKLSVSAKELSEWRSRVSALRESLLQLPSSEWTEEFVNFVREQAIRAETRAEQRAVKAARAEKDIHRIQKALARRDPSLAAVHKNTARLALNEQRDFISDLLDVALFLRSTCSSASDDSHGGPTFDTPAALDAYLRSTLAA